jgi:hypothetical protein
MKKFLILSVAFTAGLSLCAQVYNYNSDAPLIEEEVPVNSLKHLNIPISDGTADTRRLVRIQDGMAILEAGKFEEILGQLAASAGYGYMPSGGLNDKIKLESSIFLPSDDPIQVISMILHSYGLEPYYKNGMLRVFSRQVDLSNKDLGWARETAYYRLENVNFDEILKAPSSDISGGGGSSGGQDSSSSSDSGSSSSSDGGSSLGGGEIIEARDFEQTAAQSIFTKIKETILSSDADIWFDGNSKTVLIRDYAPFLDVFEDYMLEFDREQKMIKFELKVLQVSLNPDSNVGVDFMNNLSVEAAYRGVSTDILGGMFSSAPGVIGDGLSLSSSNSTSKDTFVVGTSQLSATLNFAKSFSTVETLQSPELITREGFPAYFFIGRTETVALPGGTATSGGNSSAPEILEFSFGDVLALTPSILKNDSIYVTFNFETSRAGDPTIFPTADGDISIPGTNAQRTQQVLEIPNGKTMVLSGYLSTTETETVTKTPFLGDLPYIGGAFRNRQRSSQWLNTMILITPYILESKEDIIQETAATLKRFSQVTEYAIKDAKDQYGGESGNYNSMTLKAVDKVIEHNAPTQEISIPLNVNPDLNQDRKKKLEIEAEHSNIRFGMEPYEYTPKDYPGGDDFAPNPASHSDLKDGVPYIVPRASLVQ